jgi:hypothetical protein
MANVTLPVYKTKIQAVGSIVLEKILLVGRPAAPLV